MADFYQFVSPALHRTCIASSASFTVFTLDGSTDRVAWRFQWPFSGEAISKIHFFKTHAAGTSPVYKVGIQGDSTNNPNGTFVGGASPASVDYSHGGASSTDEWQTVTLDNTHTPTRGDILHTVIQYSSGTIDGSNYLQVASDFSTTANDGLLVRSTSTDSGSSWLKNTGNNAMSGPMLLECSSGLTYGVAFPQIMTNLGDSGDGLALKFTIPATWADSYTIAGVAIGTSSGGTCNFTLWSGETVVQQDTALSFANSYDGFDQKFMFFDEATLTALTPGSTYRIGIDQTSATDHNPFGWLFPSSAALAGYWMNQVGGMRSDYDASATGGTRWSDTNTEIPHISLILEDLTQPAGGSGGGLKIVGRGGLAG